MRSTAAWLMVLGFLTVAAPGSGDRIVLYDGSQVETAGPWRQSGRMVVFTSPSGTLSSLRLDLVDLEASRRASAPPEPVTETPVPAVRPPVLVLTDEDVSRVWIDDEEEDGAPQPATPAVGGATKVAVTTWDQRYNSDLLRLEVFGTLRNDSGGVLAGISLEVAVLDESGVAVGEASAQVAQQGLVPGETTTFLAAFADLGRADSVRFTAKGFSLAIDEKAARRAAEAQPAPADSEADALVPEGEVEAPEPEAP